MLRNLTTPQGENLNGTTWTVYPRPQMKRDSYLNLNGTWEFAVGNPVFKGKTIQVPFCPESRLSGIGQHFAEGAALWYRRGVTLPANFHRGRVLLHIGAADQITDVYVNGHHAGSHEGGYDAFSFDITPFLREENEIQIRCYDDLWDVSFPYGKQVVKRGGMWYTPVSGIWQTVWMESVPETYIQKLDITNRGASVTIDTGLDMEGTVTVAGLGTYSLTHGKVTITPEEPHFWSPEDPYLYETTVQVGQDQVQTYFALRTLEIRQVGKYQRLCLNGKPYFFHGLLDQGYWPEGLLTAPGPECYESDILAMKALGFNTLRKHIKVEPEEFYYQCDKLGMVVFQDMVNNGRYDYVRDTALPTVLRASQTLKDKKWLKVPERTKQRFFAGMTATVNQLKNHPSILYWTVFNEGWGQFDADGGYEALKQLDDTRWIDTTSGWFRQSKTDVDSRHVYFRKITETAVDKPLVVSEFGGYAYKVEGHVFNPEKTYGYGSYSNLEGFENAVAQLYMDQVVPCVRRGLCAAIYTQVSDVEDEINGLRTYDRKVEKLTKDRMLPVAGALREAIEE